LVMTVDALVEVFGICQGRHKPIYFTRKMYSGKYSEYKFKSHQMLIKSDSAINTCIKRSYNQYFLISSHMKASLLLNVNRVAT
jgi:hypothetical protein